MIVPPDIALPNLYPLKAFLYSPAKLAKVLLFRLLSSSVDIILRDTSLGLIRDFQKLQNVVNTSTSALTSAVYNAKGFFGKFVVKRVKYDMNLLYMLEPVI